MSNLFWCASCQRYLNTDLYNKECGDSHYNQTMCLLNYKCEHKGLRRNCILCNPYNCECGRIVANNSHSIPQHKKTKIHRRYMKNKIQILY